MESVRAWADSHGASYARVDDEEFFADVPAPLLELKWIQPATDLARLLAARRLHERWSCSIWIDADVLVFEPRRLRLPVPRGDAAFAREVWMRRNRKGKPFCREQVANYACSFNRGSRTLDEYVETCLEAPASAAAEDRCLLGPTYLLARHSVTPLELIAHIGSLNPRLMHALLGRDMPVLDIYRRALGTSIYAANMCLSFEGERVSAETQSAVIADLVANGDRLFRPSRSTFGRWRRKPDA